MRARKKPVEVEVFQMTTAAWNEFDWPKWLTQAWFNDSGEGARLWLHGAVGQPICGTLEGPHEVSWDDWIIQGVEGEIYPCKPSVFEKTYDVVEED